MSHSEHRSAKRIILTGGSGFIGSHLSKYLQEKGHELVVLSRSPKPGCHVWNPELRQIDPSILEGTDVVINLSGESVLGRWNPEKMEKIRQSRLVSTQFLSETLLNLSQVPTLYIGASAIGYYGDRADEVLTEKSPPGLGFLSTLCHEWEGLSDPLAKKMRVVLTRFGIVLGEDGGALEQMVKPFRMGFGGALGSGKQFMSWIAIDDVLGGVEHAIQTPTLSGAVNFVSPNPLSNKEFTKALAHVLKRPALFSVPKALLETLVGSAADELLASAKVMPTKLLESGYQFRFPELEAALKKYLR